MVAREYVAATDGEAVEWGEAGELLTHPVVLLALAVWALNDHVGKVLWPGWVTGKLSDVACLVVVPVLCAGAVELGRSRSGRPARAPRWLAAGAAVAALVMVTINVSPTAAWAYEHGLGFLQWPFRAAGAWISGQGSTGLRPVALTMDPTDVLTVPAALVPLWLERRRSASFDEDAHGGVRG